MAPGARPVVQGKRKSAPEHFFDGVDPLLCCYRPALPGDLV